MTMTLNRIAPRRWRSLRRRPRVGILLGVSLGALAVVAIAAVGLAADPRLVTGSPRG